MYPGQQRSIGSPIDLPADQLDAHAMWRRRFLLRPNAQAPSMKGSFSDAA